MDKREASIDEYLAVMDAKPLTDKEKQQRDEWNKLILDPGNRHSYLNLMCLVGLISWF
jgi:hypothetical protein